MNVCIMKQNLQFIDFFEKVSKIYEKLTFLTFFIPKLQKNAQPNIALEIEILQFSLEFHTYNLQGKL